MSIKMNFRNEISKKYDNNGNKLKNIQYNNMIELLECGHQNNLKLAGRTSGICPKGDIKNPDGTITKAEVI